MREAILRAEPGGRSQQPRGVGFGFLPGVDVLLEVAA